MYGLGIGNSSFLRAEVTRINRLDTLFSATGTIFFFLYLWRHKMIYLTDRVCLPHIHDSYGPSRKEIHKLSVNLIARKSDSALREVSGTATRSLKPVNSLCSGLCASRLTMATRRWARDLESCGLSFEAYH